MNKREYRTLSSTVTPDPSSRKVTGYFAKFNTLSEDLGGFKEQLAQGCFTRTLKENPDVRALVDHDSSKIIGRTVAGTLSLSEDTVGLAFSLELPDTSYANDLRASMLRGDISACSFGFMTEKDTWEQTGDQTVRTLIDVTLLEGSIVVFPAYTDTSAQLRSLFPDGAVCPPEKRDDMSDEEDSMDEQCKCDCAECVAGDCADCSNPNCENDNCNCDDDPEFDSVRCVMQMKLEVAKRSTR